MGDDMSATTIETDDTVRFIGRRAHWTVDAINGDRANITGCWGNPRSPRGAKCVSRTARLGRLELVRKGNVDIDAMRELERVCYSIDAESAAETGETVEEYRARRAREAEADRIASAEADRKAAEDRAARAARAEADRIATERAEAARRAAEIAEADAADVRHRAHTAAHGGDFLAALLCGVGGAACPLA
jgi:hypothetical protein